MSQSLDGIRVIELARHQAGPRAGMILSDLGAEVIKIENRGGEVSRNSPPIVNGQSIYFSVYNRGKKSICLNLRTDQGKKIFFDLLKTADIVLENFRPGILEKMGLGYEELIKVKPDIILVRVTGFGQTGPYRDRPGYDPVGQAISGLMMLNGKLEGKPIGIAFSLVDRMTALHATIGTLAALRHRDRTGEGQVVDVCLLDAAFTAVEVPASYYLATGEEGGEEGRPPYEAKDGWVIIQAGPSKKMRRRIFEIVGADPGEIENNMKANDSSSFFGLRVPALIEWCKQHSVKEICDEFVAAGVPVAPVLTVAQATKDPHLWEREMLVKIKDEKAGELHVPGLTIKLSKTPGKIGAVPSPGQHTNEVLLDILKYDPETIKNLRSNEII